MRPELVLNVAEWVVGAALVVAILILMWRALLLMRRTFALAREAQARAAAAGVPQPRGSARWKRLWWGWLAFTLLFFGLEVLDPAHSVVYRRVWVVVAYALVMVLMAAFAIWLPRQIRVSERGFGARDGVRYHAPVGRLVRYTLLQGAAAVYVLAVMGGWYALMVSRLFKSPVAAPAITVVAGAAIAALYYTLPRAHGLDRRLRTWVYGGEVPHALWRSVRLHITVVWVAVGAIALVAAVLPSFVLSVH